MHHLQTHAMLANWPASALCIRTRRGAATVIAGALAGLALLLLPAGAARAGTCFDGLPGCTITTASCTATAVVQPGLTIPDCATARLTCPGTSECLYRTTVTASASLALSVGGDAGMTESMNSALGSTTQTATASCTGTSSCSATTSPFALPASPDQGSFPWSGVGHCAWASSSLSVIDTLRCTLEQEVVTSA